MGTNGVTENETFTSIYQAKLCNMCKLRLVSSTYFAVVMQYSLGTALAARVIREVAAWNRSFML